MKNREVEMDQDGRESHFLTAPVIVTFWMSISL